MFNYNRTAYVRGLDLQSIPYLKVDTIRPDSAPAKLINTANLAFADGETILGTRYGKKDILITGHIEAPQRWDYEIARDSLLGMLDSEAEVDIVFEQGSGQRKYIGIYETTDFTYIERGFVTFNIRFRATQPFGLNIEETVPVFGLELTESSNTFNFNIKGNIYSYPRLVFELTQFPDDGELRKIYIESESQGGATSLEVSYNFSEGSVLVIDGGAKQATINGIKLPYIGRFPVGKGSMNVTVRDDASDRLITAQVRYNERNM